MYTGNVVRHKQGTFFVLIITSGRILHWPYAAKSENPMYKTRQDAEYIAKEYVKFANSTSIRKFGKKAHLRYIEEFEICDITETRLN